MSKIVLVLLLFSSLFAFKWQTYEAARELQKISNKLIMIDVVRTGCHYCEEMDENVFQDKEMARWIEKRFIPVKLNLDFDDLPLGIKVMFTPTFFFVNTQEKIVKKIPGAWNIEDFKALVKDLK